MKSLIVLLSFILVMPVFAAGLGDLDLETNRYASIVATDTGEAQTLGATVIAPVDLINGGAAFSFLRTSVDVDDAEEPIVSDDLQYRIQGGPVYRGVSLQFFIDGDWGKYQDRGAFVRPGVLNIDGWRISGGVGTYLRGLEEELRLDPDDPENILKPLAFASLSRKVGDGDLSVLITWSPTFDLDENDLLFEPQWKTRLDKFDVTLSGRYGKQHEMDVREYQVQLDFPF